MSSCVVRADNAVSDRGVVLSRQVVNSCTQLSHAYKVKCSLLSLGRLVAELGWNI